MFKTLLVGIWGVLMAFAGMYLHMHLKQSAAASAEAAAKENQPKIEQATTELTGVPVLVEGRVQGYLVFRLDSTFDRAKLPSAEMNINPYLTDAAFRASYDFASKGSMKVRRQDVEGITSAIQAMVDDKLGKGVVLAVNLEQFNFIRSDEVRGNLFQVQ